MVEKYTQPFSKILSNGLYHLFWVFLLITHIAWENQPKPLLEKKRQAIRNGSTLPENLLLSDQQINAIGWLYFDNPSNAFCTATVISPQAVITAKHCFLDENGQLNTKIQNANIFGFGLGASPFAPEQTDFTFTPDIIKFHPTLDIAVIEFAFGSFSRLGIEPIVLNDQPLEDGLYDAYIGQMMDIGGFGATYSESQFGRFFASVKFELMSSESIFVNGLNMMGICGGDSGALLLAAGADGKVKGIALEFKGDPCCMGVDQLTRLDIAFDWLLSHVEGVYQSDTLSSKGCWGISELGLCRDGRLITCEQGQYRETNCNDLGLICSKNGSTMGCTEPIAECVNLDANGVCDASGKKIYRCVQQTVIELSCDSNQYCEVNNGRAICMNIIGAVTETGEDADEIPECSSEENLTYAERLQGKMIAQPSCQTSDRNMTWLMMGLFCVMIALFLRWMKNKAVDQN